MDSKISIRQYTAEDLQAIIMIWNAAQKAGEIPYKPLIKERFKQQFIESPAYDSAFLLVAEFGDEVVGFISGAVKKDFCLKKTMKIRRDISTLYWSERICVDGG